MKTKTNKTETLVFRVTEQQKKEIEHKASDMSVSLSAYLSHLISDYENQKIKSQQSDAKSIEVITQKNILDKALNEAQKDAQMLANPAFTDFYGRVHGKKINGKLINSKYDLLSVMASSAELSQIDEEVEVHIPLEVKMPAPESITKTTVRWELAIGIFLLLLLLFTIYFGISNRSSRTI